MLGDCLGWHLVSGIAGLALLHMLTRYSLLCLLPPCSKASTSQHPAASSIPGTAAGMLDQRSQNLAQYPKTDKSGPCFQATWLTAKRNRGPTSPPPQKETPKTSTAPSTKQLPAPHATQCTVKPAPSLLPIPAQNPAGCQRLLTDPPCLGHRQLTPPNIGPAKPRGAQMSASPLCLRWLRLGCCCWCCAAVAAIQCGCGWPAVCI